MRGELAMGEEEQKPGERGNTLARMFLSLWLPGGTLLSADTAEQRVWFNCKKEKKGGGAGGENLNR